MSTDMQDALAGVREAQERLMKWLLDEACPLWSTRGVDRDLGGFHEMLIGAEPVSAPRRARVQPRQIAAFAGASRLGWKGDAAELAVHGRNYFVERFRRPDGLFRTLIAPDGKPLDERALLYDQAFALLGLAEMQRQLNSPGIPRSQSAEPAAEARALRSLIYCHFKREGPGFESAVEQGLALSSNAHMHLLEASLAWLALAEDAEWRALADEIGELALSRFIDPVSGAVREHFSSAWAPLPGLAGRLLEPGHHFEWAWLLLRWAGNSRGDACIAALRLLDIGEKYGVFNGVAVNALVDDFSVHDACARLWPQTERVKGAALAARLTGDVRYWNIAREAAIALLRYLDTPVRGSWYDRLLPYGRFIEEPAPASSFYHIVGAITELTAAIEAH
jgi:mannose/cellobiose epimerase-like protein (N-acyl-D-glucosamine 2-epimerase family)